jgi:hypothetical protein
LNNNDFIFPDGSDSSDGSDGFWKALLLSSVNVFELLLEALVIDSLIIVPSLKPSEPS